MTWFSEKVKEDYWLNLATHINGEIKLVDKLGLKKLKTELNALKESGDIQALGKREAEVARLFQQAISEYPYNMETCHIAGNLK